MARLNRAYVKKLEDLILQLDTMFSDIETAWEKGYLTRDILALKKEADIIRASRSKRITVIRQKK
jgi:hypothetical protein